MSLEELKAELLRSEFPSLRPDHDPDIERYFELRAAGRPVDALSFYESRIKPRYPDDAYRTAVLRAYRLKDPSYASYVGKSYTELGSRLLERTKRMIKYIALYASSYDRRDAYATIRAAESILRMLPRDRYEAVAAIERLRRHAELLDYLTADMNIAEELVRAYVNEQIDVVEMERNRRRLEQERLEREQRSLLVEQDRAETARSLDEARKRKREEEKRRDTKRSARSESKAAPVFDLSTIRFSAADLARIQIPPVITSVEDKTLAFCFKYWNLVDDRAFERVIFLFSRKYGVKNYDIYSAIRDGRRRGRRDEEILASVSGLLTSGYYYSIRGDVYLQRGWARLKAKIDPTAIAAPAAEEAEPKAARPARRKRAARRASKQQRPAAGRTAAPQASKRPADPSEPKAKPVLRTAPARMEKAAAGKRAKKAPIARQEEQTATRVPKGSVSDRLKKLSGKSYDVFQDRFFAKARSAIRSVLAESRNGKKSLFPSIPQEAEDLVFIFLRDHYANPYMDWEASAERENLSRLGYELSSLDPVIENCYRLL